MSLWPFSKPKNTVRLEYSRWQTPILVIANHKEYLLSIRHTDCAVKFELCHIGTKIGTIGFSEPPGRYYASLVFERIAADKDLLASLFLACERVQKRLDQDRKDKQQQHDEFVSRIKVTLDEITD